MDQIQSLLDMIVPRLTTVGGVAAVVLGGSWATGTQHADSDVDLGLYYRSVGRLLLPPALLTPVGRPDLV